MTQSNIINIFLSVWEALWDVGAAVPVSCSVWSDFTGLHISVVVTLKVQCVWYLTLYCHKSDIDQIQMILKVWLNVVDEWMKGWTVGQTAWQLSQCNSIIGTGTGELRSCAVRTTKDRPSHFTPRFTPSPYKLNRSHFGVRTLPSPSQNTLRTRWLVKPTNQPKKKKNQQKNSQETLMTTSLHPPQHRLLTPLLSGWRHRRVKCTPYRPRSSTQQSLDGSIVHPPGRFYFL